MEQIIFIIAELRVAIKPTWQALESNPVKKAAASFNESRVLGGIPKINQCRGNPGQMRWRRRLEVLALEYFELRARPSPCPKPRLQICFVFGLRPKPLQAQQHLPRIE